jgi:predicted dehydrogenase
MPLWDLVANPLMHRNLVAVSARAEQPRSTVLVVAGPMIALVGAGRWGALILRDLVTLGAAVYVVDVDETRRERASDMGAARAMGTIDELPRVDGVVVATPASTHAAMVDACAGLGAPMFCEKPLTTDLASARRLVADHGDHLYVMHVWRYHPGVELLGRLAANGDFGTVHGLLTTRVNWTSPRVDIDPVWTLVPHDLSIAIEILGAIPAPRSAMIEQLHDQTVSMWASLGGGGVPWHVLEASTRFADKRREIRVHGSDAVGVLSGPDAAGIEVFRGAGSTVSADFIPIDQEPALRRELRAFLDHLDGRGSPKSDATEGADVVNTVTKLLGLNLY